MKQRIGAALMMAAVLTIAADAALADELVTESRAVDARVVKVDLDGVINLTIKQGAKPGLTLYGEKKQVAQVITSEHGDTLHIDGEEKHVHFGGERKLRAELILPNLNEFVSHGVGASEVTGFSGDNMNLALNGAGAVTLNSNYQHVEARLSGVGSMTLNAGESERIALDLRGTGQIVINGHSKMLRATLRGLGSLEARQLRADSVDLDMTGLGSATVYAVNSAKLNLSGMGSATVYGKPASRQVSARGLGSVSWP